MRIKPHPKTDCPASQSRCCFAVGNAHGSRDSCVLRGLRGAKELREKVVARMFREGIDGFKGGLSAGKLHQHHQDFPRNRDKKPARSCRNGPVHENRRTQADAVQSESARGRIGSPRRIYLLGQPICDALLERLAWRRCDRFQLWSWWRLSSTSGRARGQQIASHVSNDPLIEPAVTIGSGR